jgi:hypothetical protein
MTFILSEDAAIKTYLAGIAVSDERANPRAVNVWFGYPDVEIRTQNYPFITIDLVSIRQANDRQMSGYTYDGDYMGTTPVQEGKWYGYEIPLAYDLVYQVTSYSRHPRHDRAIMYQLHEKFPSMRGYLPVPNDLGTSTAYRHMFLESMTKSDRAEGENGNKRLLRNIFTVRVVSQLTPAQVADLVPQVTSVTLNKTPLSASFPTDKYVV